MNQEDRDRILQLIAYVRLMNYHAVTLVGDGPIVSAIMKVLPDAMGLCNPIVESLGPSLQTQRFQLDIERDRVWLEHITRQTHAMECQTEALERMARALVVLLDIVVTKSAG